VDSSDLTRLLSEVDELVSVRLYDGDNQTPQDIPALELINYSNESKKKTLALRKQLLSRAHAAAGRLPAAGRARVLAIADRFAWGISVWRHSSTTMRVDSRFARGAGSAGCRRSVPAGRVLRMVKIGRRGRRLRPALKVRLGAAPCRQPRGASSCTAEATRRPILTIP